ncbi:histidinol-phosphate aminotransferase family protein [Pelagibacteraceae bacterium]|nr:histidinol-phosphate aminotransferase family protein [Pelagibacteraceae bacterium]
MKSKNTILKKTLWADKINRIRGPIKTRFNKVRLDKNEKPDKHISNLIKKIKKNIKHEHLTAYPETEILYKAISKKLKINKESIVLTPGSDAAIKNCLDLFTEKNDKIITIDPTFAMVDIYSKIKRVKQIKIKYNEKLNLDYKKIYKTIKNEKINLIILANPNSPTGTAIPKKILFRILKLCLKKNIIVLIDEAYYGFYKFTMIKYINKFSNLVVCRTFSKAYGLAGCRVGFLAANKNLAGRLYNLRPMYEINSLGVMIASEILKKNIFVVKNLKDQLDGKKYLIKELKKLKIHYLDGHANFIHINLGNKKSKAEKTFFKNNILIRGGLNISGYNNFLRVSLGPQIMMKRVVKILKNILK